MTLWEMIRFMSDGIAISFKLTPLVILSTLVLGTILAIIQFKRIFILSHLIDLYITVMRGIPPLVVLLITYYSFNLGTPFIAALVSMSVYHSAYVAEIIRGGLTAVPKGQYEAGESLGLPYPVIMVKLIVPQIFLQTVPALCGQYILVVKDTTLVSAVGVQEILWSGRQLMNITFKPFQVFLLVGVFFYLICVLIELFSNRVEAKLKQKKRVFIGA